MLIEYQLNLEGGSSSIPAAENHIGHATSTHLGLVHGRFVARAVASDGMYRIVRGDLEPDMELTLTVTADDDEETPAPGLDVATSITMRWRKPDGTFVADVELELVDAVTAKVKRVWVDGDTDAVGVHVAQVVVVHENSEPQTFPSDGTFYTWHVYEQLGATTP